MFFFSLIFNAYTFLFCSVGPISHVGTQNDAVHDNMGHSNQGKEPEYVEIGEFKNVDHSDPHYQSPGTIFENLSWL